MSRTYSLIWRNKWLTTDANTIDEMIAALEAAVAELRAMRDAGVQLEGGAEDDYACLITDDPAVAAQYGFEEEDEPFEADDFGGSNGHGEGPLAD